MDSKKGKNSLEYGDHYNQNQSRDIYSKKRGYRKTKVFNVVIGVLSLIFAIVGGGILYSYHILNSFNYEEIESQEESSIGDETSCISGENSDFLKDNQVLNIMLFGLDDQSAKDNGRTDTMLMVSIDNRHKKLKFTTFMRDLWVQIPQHSQRKLNAAFAFGGPKLAIETIERNFGVSIDRYAMVHFDGFADIVDALGGIDIELTKNEAATINKLCKREGMTVEKELKKVDGVQHLVGVQALNHARNRDSAGSDFDRTARQRCVMSAIVSKLKQSNIKQIFSIISSIAPKVTMNFKKYEVIKLASNALKYANYKIEEYRVPEDSNYKDAKKSNGEAVLEILDIKEARRNIAKFLYEDSLETSN